MTSTTVAPGDPGLERALRAAIEGEVRFDAFTRGLYATDASLAAKVREIMAECRNDSEL